MLSAITCESIILGVAPMARRMPISPVRSLTVTIMMLLTPMAPETRVPMPTSQMRKFTPWNRLSSMAYMISVLNTVTPSVSSGEMEWARASVVRMRSAMVLITTPFLPVTAIRSTAVPRL